MQWWKERARKTLLHLCPREKVCNPMAESIHGMQRDSAISKYRVSGGRECARTEPQRPRRASTGQSTRLQWVGGLMSGSCIRQFHRASAGSSLGDFRQLAILSFSASAHRLLSHLLLWILNAEVAIDVKTAVRTLSSCHPDNNAVKVGIMIIPTLHRGLGLRLKHSSLPKATWWVSVSPWSFKLYTMKITY